MTNKALTIKGFELTAWGTMLQWVDSHGLHHSTELEEVYSYCERGQYGLSAKDARTIKRALHKQIVELEIGQKIPGEYHEVGERVE